MNPKSNYECILHLYYDMNEYFSTLELSHHCSATGKNYMIFSSTFKDLKHNMLNGMWNWDVDAKIIRERDGGVS